MADNDTPGTSPLRDGSLLERVRESASERAAIRAERRTQFAQVKPEPRLSIVAWIDLLGFREQIVNADTPEKFQAAYRRMREVHEEFDKESASAEPDQADLNASLGIQILALSDGLVIALDLEGDSAAAQVLSIYERAGSFLEALRLAQVRCASVGNLVRGGVALGYFWFRDDILLSPALVSAYEMETKFAKNPVIILERELAEKLHALKAGEGFSPDWNPMDDLFRDCDWMEESARSKYVMMNFMPVFLGHNDPTTFLRNYQSHLIAAREAAPQCAKEKIEFLIGYAREFVQTKLPTLEGEIFGPARATNEAIIPS